MATYSKSSYSEMMDFFRTEILLVNSKTELYPGVVITTDGAKAETYNIPENEWDQQCVINQIIAYAESDGKEGMLTE
jgi:hypothetical protein